MLRTGQSMPRAYFLPWTLMAMFAGALPYPAMAQAQDAAQTGAALARDGNIIYSRDVSHGVGSPNFPGASHEAVTAPTNTMLAAVSTGLAPLTDRENASVTATLPRALAVLGTVPAAGLLAGGPGGQAGQFANSESASYSPGAAISGAMQSLHGALGTLSVISGGKP